MASCISFTARSRPMNTDLLMIEWPMFNSSISGMPATGVISSSMPLTDASR